MEECASRFKAAAAERDTAVPVIDLCEDEGEGGETLHATADECAHAPAPAVAAQQTPSAATVDGQSARTRAFPCTKCGRFFANPKDLAKHADEAHPVAQQAALALALAAAATIQVCA